MSILAVLIHALSGGVSNTKQFLTECNLRQQLSTLAEDESREYSMPVLEGMSPDLTVSEMNNKRLTIDIKPHKSKKKHEDQEEDEDSLEAPHSAEIQVIHKHPLPSLHGILKQRTISESSEDFYLEDPSSPRSGDDVDPLSSSSSSFSKRRSVSFNAYVDRTSFKSAAAPSAMTTALKSKRRRQRKREMRASGRTRSTSEGTSEGSSCEYISHSEGEVESEPEGGQSHPGASQGVDIPKLSSTEKKKNKKKNRKGRRVDREHETESSDQVKSASPDSEEGLGSSHDSEEGLGSSHDSEEGLGSSHDSEEGVVAENGLDFRTKSEKCTEGSVGDGDVDKKVEVSVVKEATESDSDKVLGESNSQVEKNKKIVSEIKSKLAAGSGKGAGDAVVEKVDSDDDDVGDGCEEKSVAKSRTGGGDERAGSDVKDGGDGQVEEPKPKSDVETMLSWDDAPQNGGEHVTHCAVRLENSVMFDLDVD